jgi:hypothetical protein
MAAAFYDRAVKLSEAVDRAANLVPQTDYLRSNIPPQTALKAPFYLCCAAEETERPLHAGSPFGNLQPGSLRKTTRDNIAKVHNRELRGQAMNLQGLPDTVGWPKPRWTPNQEPDT